MERRDALRALGTVVTLPIIGGPGSEGLLEMGRRARRELGLEPYRRQTLTQEEADTVAEIADIIIPETDSPGAAAAGVAEFVDLIVSEWFDDEERSGFLASLTAVDGLCRQRFGVDFAECTQREKVDVVQRMDAEMFGADAPSDHYFFQIKRLTLIGYFTSEVGMRQELNYRIRPGRYVGCGPAQEAR